MGIDTRRLWVHINASSGVPIYLQLKNQLRRAVAGGVLRPGDRLPPVRDLAAEAVVNPNTVARVYRELELEGLLQTQRGVGTFVAPGAGAGGLLAERERLLDAAAQRYLSETAQLGLTPAEAIGFLTKITAAGAENPPEREGGNHGPATGDQDQEPEQAVWRRGRGGQS